MSTLNVPVPLNRKQPFDCLIKFIDKTANEKNVEFFPTCFCCLNFNIGVKERTAKLIFLNNNRKPILSAVGLGL